MKIRIKRANTDRPIFRLESGVLHFSVQGLVFNYLDELRQQAKWDAEKCKS